LDLVLDRLDQREASGKDFVELVPLATGPKDLHRLKRLFRFSAYQRYYPNSPETRPDLERGVREKIKANPPWLDEALARIARELEARPQWVYASRDKGFSWNGDTLPVELDPARDGD